MSNPQVIIFGEVLFDRFPDGKMVLGGAPFNVAWHLQGFGVSPLFISRVGNDSEGEKIKQSITDWGMDLSGIQTDKQYPTGVVNVEFKDNEPHYNIVENSAYDFIDSSYIPYLDKNSILYHGSLALRNNTSKTTLESIKKNISPSIFLDVNLRSPFWNLNSIESLLTQTLWLKLNKEELSFIVPQEKDTIYQVESLFCHNPIEQITVTLGKAGVISFNRNTTRHQICPPSTISVVDTVGAGDAFSSVLLLGIVKGWDISTTLQRAQEFASKIIGIQGATTFDRGFYDTFV
ncbi:carbohydrate kinase [Geminocystis sp. NIES-3709]|uniref:carbohydrate kinase family protein n=1 Tax=Geminocystis sp. NIES-3709 TaxID=1617448 RepID=UPI0005FC9C0E|nr:carbohydrate kinase [Geminocystis sp. NIES-3709]BAQ65681.1 fructokinase [Geminocystis sp. NIES-3709]